MCVFMRAPCSSCPSPMAVTSSSRPSGNGGPRKRQIGMKAPGISRLIACSLSDRPYGVDVAAARLLGGAAVVDHLPPPRRVAAVGVEVLLVAGREDRAHRRVTHADR